MKPEIKRIYKENNDFQRVEVIKRNREKRNKYKEFFVEGVQSINYALENNWHIKTFIYPAEKSLSRWATDILQNSKAETHMEMPIGMVDKLSDKDEDTSEMLAVVAMPDNDLPRIKVKDDMLVVVFDRPSSHGNLGTLIRSCEALKVDSLIITGHAVDLYDPKTIRASMGTIFSLPVIRQESHKELLPWFDHVREKLPGFQIIGSTSRTEKLVEEANLSGPLVLLIGNETHGLSSSYKELCNQLVKIPMYGRITSFNVSCAASIMLYEVDRQRRLGTNR